MTTPIRIALDAMGGDNAPVAVVGGAALAHERHPQIQFQFYGDQSVLKPLLERRRNIAGSVVIHTDSVITNDAKVAVALRNRKSSMRLAIDAVASGAADCVVSAGNTGALFAIGKMVLKMLPGIDRPAMASFFPTTRGESVMLDLGANLECTAENLTQFALMGAVFATAALGIKTPSIGILNVGSEEMKGNDSVRSAASALRAMAALPGTFHGFVEGNDIAIGTTDVVVTDGFTGNVALKTSEGLSKLYFEFLQRTFRSSFLAGLGYLLARGAFRKLRARIDHRRYNGAVFLGVNGVCVKSHGSADAVAFANAISVAVDMVMQGANAKIREGVAASYGGAAMPVAERDPVATEIG